MRDLNYLECHNIVFEYLPYYVPYMYTKVNHTTFLCPLMQKSMQLFARSISMWWTDKEKWVRGGVSGAIVALTVMTIVLTVHVSHCVNWLDW